MPERAHVTSVDALRAFRTALIIYVSKARPTIEEVSADVLRTRMWLESDRRVHWEAQVRKRRRKLEEAQQNLFAVSMSKLRDVTMAERLAVRKAKEALEEAEDKLGRVKQWIRELDAKLEPLTRQLEKLHTVLSNDMTNAIAHLDTAAQTLEAYAEVPVPGAAAASDAKESPPAPAQPAPSPGSKS
jgi:hypothetical protein